jgi:flavin-dependent dehydrogenase
MKKNSVLLLGGGLAGLIAAIHLSRIGIQVTVIERNGYPKHKVCGEYISNEVLPYLEWLDCNLAPLSPTGITRLQFSTAKGKSIWSELPLGGFGISRYALDSFLCKKAIDNGCKIIHETVESVTFENDMFEVITTNANVYKSKIVIGAFGKRSNIDQKMNRDFINYKSPWLAVKGHYLVDYPNDLVGLHNFKGGYCGVSQVENKVVNICYLADYDTFKQYKNLEEYQQAVVAQNPHLKTIFQNAKLLFEKQLTISQISFDKKQAVENHVLMIGDTAGLIHPLCGNGMAMAIHSAKIVSELVAGYYADAQPDRAKMEWKYAKAWDLNFKSRLRFGRWLALLFKKPLLSEVLLNLLLYFPFLLPIIIKKTHGKPIILPK